MKKLGLIVSLLFLIATPSLAEYTYTAEFEKEFLKECQAGQAKMADCQCLLNGLKQDVSQETITELYQASLEGDQNKLDRLVSIIDKAKKACNIQ